MTRSVHTVKYMQANYRKYQLLAVTCALLTITASILAAFSGIRINTLRKTAASLATSASQAQAAAASDEVAKTHQALTEAQTQLNAEREQIADLKQKIGELERRLASAEIKPTSDMTTAPSLLKPESGHPVRTRSSSATSAMPAKAVAPETSTAIQPAQQTASHASLQTQQPTAASKAVVGESLAPEPAQAIKTMTGKTVPGPAKPAITPSGASSPIETVQQAKKAVIEETIAPSSQRGQ